MNRKVGFYRKSSKSNQRLVGLFEELQEERLQADWEDTNSFSLKSLKKIGLREKKTRKEVIEMLKKGEIKTSDDFYRAAMLFQHGGDFKSYALAIALAAVSGYLGESWGRGLYAMAIDRFLLSIGQKQYFGTNLEKVRGKWHLAPYNRKTSDYERQSYLIGSMKDILKEIKKLNRKSDQ